MVQPWCSLFIAYIVYLLFFLIYFWWLYVGFKLHKIMFICKGYHDENTM